MPTPEDVLRDARLEKLGRLRNKGVDPYPSNYQRSHTSQQAKAEYSSSLENSDSKTDRLFVSVAGRVIAWRSMGKATFLDLLDIDGKIQVIFKQDVVEGEYEDLKDVDIGDWVGVSGFLFETRTKEVTVEVKKWQVLSKSIRPLPEKWHGLTEIETRYRQRYLDLIANENSREIVKLRSNTLNAIRSFMNNRGFLEVETPILVPLAAGGTARPFSTHYNMLRRDLYLRIATELYLKRLVVGGIEKVYEIGKTFRNEGFDHTHNPEFTMMESYEALSDYKDVMCMTEDLLSFVSQGVLNKTEVEFEGNNIDFSSPWKKIVLKDAVKQYADIDFDLCKDIDSLSLAMERIGINPSGQKTWGGMVDKIIDIKVQPNFIQPTFLIDYPVEMSPLAKKKPEDSDYVERFEGFIAGMEVCNAFSELNDPIDQRERLEMQESLRAKYDLEETDRLDEDYILALEHGMPPTGGLGLGIDRLVMLLSNQNSIREVIAFPQLKSQPVEEKDN